MKLYMNYLAGLALVGLMGCTSLSEGSAETDPLPDHDRRVQFQSSDNVSELRRGMNEQASETNRKRNIEDSGTGTNSPGTTPPLLRPDRTPNAPIETERHIMPVPAPAGSTPR